MYDFNDVTHFNDNVRQLDIPEFIKTLDFFIYHSNDNISDDVSEFVFKNVSKTAAVENEDESHLLNGKRLSSIIEINVEEIKDKMNNLFLLAKSDNIKGIIWPSWTPNKLSNIKAIRILEAKVNVYDISNDRIEIFNDQLIQPSKNVKSLHLSSNKIHSIGDFKFENLTTLSLNNNLLESLSLDLNHLKKLRNLSVIANGLKTIKFTNSEGNTLQNLYLQNNKIEDITLTEQIIKLAKLQKLHLQDNLLKEVESIKLVKIRIPYLQEFHVYNNDFSDESVNKLKKEEAIEGNNRFKISAPSFKDEGIRSAIDFGLINEGSTNDQKILQLKSIGKWEDIPMFSAITGLNGIGKSTILEYIFKLSLISNDTIHKYEPLLMRNGTFIRWNREPVQSTETYFYKKNKTFMNIIVVPEEVTDDCAFNKSNKPFDQALGPNRDHKISPRIFKWTDMALRIFEMNDFSNFLSKKGFKYNKVVENESSRKWSRKNQRKFSLLTDKGTAIDINDLSSGESLIFRLLTWQYMFSHKMYRTNKILFLCDEPDSHLHPSAVKELVDNLKDLCSLGVQIILTTHNPTTVSFIEKENLFLMEKQGDKLSIRKGLSATEIYHKLTSRLVNIETPSRKIFIEGEDSEFYGLIHTFLNKTNLVGSHFQLNFMPLPGGGEIGRRNKKTIISFMKNVEPGDGNPDYDSIHSYYGIVDDDNDSFRADTPDKKNYRDIINLFVLNRYSKENYVLDPINIYFYLTSLKDVERKKNKNIEDLWTYINNSVDSSLEFTFEIKQKLLGFSLKDIYQEIQKPTKLTSENIKNFLQMIVNKVKEKVFSILFETEETFFKLSFSNEYSLTKRIILKWFLNLDSDFLNDFMKIFKKHIWKDRQKYLIDFLKQLKSFNRQLAPIDEKRHGKQCVLMKNIEILKKSIKSDTELYNFLKNLCNEETTVTVLGIELKYPKFFTCLRGHDLDRVLRRNEMFTGIMSCDKIIDKFKETGMGIFIPDEIINIYRTMCHNIIHDKNVTELVKKKYKNTNWFILNKTDNCEEFKR